MSDVAAAFAQTLRLRAALEQQVGALEALSTRVEEARAGVPRSAGAGIWDGEAHRLYAAAVEALAGELATVDTLIRSALSHTRRALSTMVDPAG